MVRDAWQYPSKSFFFFQMNQNLEEVTYAYI
uniref:Uncharacterized protein n=1 Tax=Anguilla anguilla TaxID=7936 RepID=A0A0E9SM99_ANGAN